MEVRAVRKLVHQGGSERGGDHLRNVAYPRTEMVMLLRFQAYLSGADLVRLSRLTS